MSYGRTSNSAHGTGGSKHITDATPAERPAFILQRITHALREQNWVAVALEFLIVVSGVVLGFQITAWNEAQAEREQGETNLALIVEEVRKHRTDAQQSYDNANSVLRSVRTVRLGAEDPEFARANPEAFMRAVFQSQYPSFRPFDRVVYDGMESSGGIAFIDRPEALALIREHYRFVRGLNENYGVDGLRAHDNYNDAMARFSDLEIFLAFRGEDAPTLFENSPQEWRPAPPTPELAFETARRIGSDPSVEGPLAAISAYHFVVMNVSERMVGETDELLAEITNEAQPASQ